MQNMDITIASVREIMLQVAAFLPKFALAIGVLLVGWLLAKLVRLAIVKGLRAINFNVLTERAGLEDFIKQGGVETDTTGILGLLAYWLVILAALVVGCNSMGLTHITSLLGEVVRFVPKVVVAILILAFGGYFARFVGNAVFAYCKNIAMQDADLLGRLAKYFIMTFVVLIALEQVNVGGYIVQQSFLIILAGVVFALALAFGLGGRKVAAELIDLWWPRNRKSKEE